MRLSISTKVVLGFAVVLATFGMVTGFGVYQMHRIGLGLALVSRSYHPLTRIGAQLESAFRQSELATSRLLEETEGRTRHDLLRLALDYYPVAAREKLKAGQAVLQAARNSPAGRSEAPFLDRLDGLLASVALRYDEYLATGAEVRAALAELDTARLRQPELVAAKAAAFDTVVRRLKRAESAIGGSLKEFAGEVDERIDQRVRQAGYEERRSSMLIVLLMVLAVSVGIFITVISQRILAPIRRLTEAVKDVGEGRFTREITVNANDELSVLAREFNAMSRKLLERERQLQEKTAEVLRAERLAAVGRLAAQITHEIRNPLSSLSLNTELLEEQIESGLEAEDEKQEARALVKSMAREVDRLTGVTEEYLRFARMPKPTFSVVELNDAMDELLAFMGPELAAAGVEVKRDWLDPSPRVRADAGQLRQVVLNLVRNAREAAGRGGHLQLRTRMEPDAGWGVVDVIDDGPGISDQIRAHLFEPFYSTKEGGTGLGLALVQQVLHEHGGEVACESEAGQGTRFILRWPLVSMDASEAVDAVA